MRFSILRFVFFFSIFGFIKLFSPTTIYAANSCSPSVVHDAMHGCKPLIDGAGNKYCVQDYEAHTLSCDANTCSSIIFSTKCNTTDCTTSLAAEVVSCGSPGSGSCNGPTGGPCSGSCGGDGVCKAATAGNGGACGCHPKPPDDGKVCETSKDCRKGGCTGGTTPSSGCGSCKDGQSCCARTTCCTPTEPGAPTLNLPVNGSSSTNTTVTLSWNAPDWGDDCLVNANKKFEVYIGTDPTTPYLYKTLASNGYSTTFNGTAGITYYWKVIAINALKQKSSLVRSFKITDNTVSGIVYYDAANSCSLATSVPWNKGGGLTAQLTNPSVRTASIPSGGANAGQFSIIAPNGTYGSLRLLGLPNTYKCSTSCSQACPTKTGVISPSTNNRFFITDQILSSEGWWQVVGGPVYVGSKDGGTTIRSELPLATSKLILPGSGGGTEGVLVRASGNADLGDGTVSTSGWSTKGAYKGKITDYGYFAAALGVIQGQDSDWSSNVIDLATYPTTKNFGYIKPPSGTASLSGTWHVTTGKKYIIFVDGDLNVNFNVTVDNGGFLALIAKGDITVGPEVANVQGLYVANGDFISASQYVAGVTNDIPLNAEGSFVAWGTIDLRRNLGGIDNTTTPAEKFTHRPDLLINMPTKMKTFAMQWQEVPAGSF